MVRCLVGLRICLDRYERKTILELKIAILSLAVRFGDTTGDCLQAEKTAQALRRLGHDARRFYFEPETGEVRDETNSPVGKFVETMRDMDVVHAIPPIPFPLIESLRGTKSLLAVSTIFWSSPVYWRVVLRNSSKLNVDLAKGLMREAVVSIGIKPLRRKFNGYDLLLPNSEDEESCVRKYCKLKQDAIVSVVPNAIDSVPDWVANLPRLDGLPKEDYIVVPACFAPRKNQMTLIKALRDCSYPVVFMGDGLLLNECKKAALPHMVFLGHVEHQSRLFYSALKYARVACLPSNCETPGIAALEAAVLGARPVVPQEGGTRQYYGRVAEYINPLSTRSIRCAVERAWERGRLSECDSKRFVCMTWSWCAETTLEAYERARLVRVK